MTVSVYEHKGTLIIRTQYAYGTVIGLGLECVARNAVRDLRRKYMRGWLK